MRVRLICWQCGDDGEPVTTALAPLRDDSRYEIDCARHGRSVLRVQNLRFELLFEAGVLSLCEGRTRDAVLDIGAALERFIEFYLDVSRIRRGVPDEQWARFWKRVKNASERQLGAFLVARLLDAGSGEGPPGSWATFRNRVVHQGYIPEFEETIVECEQVRAYIADTIASARAADTGAFMRGIVRATLPSSRDASGSTAIHLPTLLSAITPAAAPTLAVFVRRMQNYIDTASHAGQPLKGLET